jgi:hypothetical protein
MHPFIVTKKTFETLIDACQYVSSSQSCDNCASWYDCCWMCLPCSFVVDIIICLPMTGIYLFNKCNCKCKCDKKTKVKKVKEVKNINDVKNINEVKNIKVIMIDDKNPIKSSNINIISTAPKLIPTALENPNNYEIK